MIQGRNIIKVLYQGISVEEFENVKEDTDDIRADQEELLNYFRDINDK